MGDAFHLGFGIWDAEWQIGWLLQVVELGYKQVFKSGKNEPKGKNTFLRYAENLA